MSDKAFIFVPWPRPQNFRVEVVPAPRGGWAVHHVFAYRYSSGTRMDVFEFVGVYRLKLVAQIGAWWHRRKVLNGGCDVLNEALEGGDECESA